MNAPLAKTKAEQALAQNFEAVAAKLPGGRAVADARKAAIGAFVATGLPHRRIEEWKYFDLRVTLKNVKPPATPSVSDVSASDIAAALGPLSRLDAYPIVFVDGTYRPDLSQTTDMKGLDVTPLALALGKPGVGLLHDEMPSHAAVVALNTAFVTDGAVVRVAQGAELSKPLLLIFARSGSEGHLVTTRNIVTVGVDAKACVVEAHVVVKGAAPGEDNTLTDITVGEGAHLSHIKVALAGGGDTHHLGTGIVKLNASSVYRGFQVTADTAFARNTTFLTYVGEDAQADFSGVFLGRGNENIDTTLLIDHATPGCESRELFKGVLDDNARGVFQGKVIVRQAAQKTDGKQMAQALMLSENAEFDSKPELEIYADDVACGHGSTSAELDPELLFYMRSRGIDIEAARALLIESFIGEAIDKIEDEAVREVVSALASGRLSSWASASGAKG